ncbi:MAG TPA: OsmC family protein [Methylomirabilota bacterium]|nr:OsmC family protein [Methylomirabilota bacterium]
MTEAAAKPSRTTLTREAGFRFRVRFDTDGMGELVTDEPPPLGAGQGPDPSRLLAAAIGNCLAASLLFCMGKARLEVRGLEAAVEMTIGRSPEGRLRVQKVDVQLVPTVSPEVKAQMGRCLGLFESFCTVTESIRHGIEVAVSVNPEIAA